jgi:hypothetical protein
MRRPFGIQTTYRGRVFRSRLEARWAAFFDRIGWRYEYEPFDLPRWIPDFVLMSPPYKKGPCLVEVKPIVEIDRAVAEEMVEAVEGTDYKALLLLGCEPHWEKRRWVIGWMWRGGGEWRTGGLSGDCECDVDYEGAWREAGNRVQWNPARAAEELTASQAYRVAQVLARNLRTECWPDDHCHGCTDPRRLTDLCRMWE